MSLVGVSGARLVRALKRVGFVKAGGKGSHVKLKHPNGRIVIVPMHREIAPGTMRSILGQAGLTEEALRALL